MLILRVTHGLMLGQHYELHDIQAHKIGRTNGELALLDDKVSRKHAELYATDGRWFINDLGSTNGTYINGQRIVNPTVLAERDVIQVGMTVILVEAVTGGVTTTTAEDAVPVNPPQPTSADTVPSTATQPIHDPFPPLPNTAETTYEPEPSDDQSGEAAYAGPVSPAAWAVIGYSIVVVAGVLVDIIMTNQ